MGKVERSSSCCTTSTVTQCAVWLRSAKFKGNKKIKQTKNELDELQRYISFLEKKRNGKLEILYGDNRVGEDNVLQVKWYYQQG